MATSYTTEWIGYDVPPVNLEFDNKAVVASAKESRAE